MARNRDFAVASATAYDPNFEPNFFVEVFTSKAHNLNTEAGVLLYFLNFTARAKPSTVATVLQQYKQQ